MIALATALAIYGVFITVIHIIVQGSANDLTRDNKNLHAENRLLRRDAARAYGHPSTFAPVVDLDRRRER